MIETKVYILLTDTGSLFTRLLKRYTKIMLPYPSTQHYQRYIVVGNLFNGGFVKEDVKEFVWRETRLSF